jgi:hypothetical protein
MQVAPLFSANSMTCDAGDCLCGSIDSVEWELRQTRESLSFILVQTRIYSLTPDSSNAPGLSADHGTFWLFPLCHR